MKSLNFNTMYDWPIGAKAVVLGILFLIVFYLGYRWNIASLKSNYQDLVAQEADLKQQFESIVVKEETLKTELVQFSSLQLMLNDWRKQLPVQDNLPELLNEILKMGAARHIFFSLFDPGDEVKEKPYWFVPIKVVMVGDYDQISIFLSQLANMPWILAIRNFVFSDENKNDVLGARLATIANEQNLLTAEVTLSIYFIPPKQEEAPANESKG